MSSTYVYIIKRTFLYLNIFVSDKKNVYFTDPSTLKYDYFASVNRTFVQTNVTYVCAYVFQAGVKINFSLDQVALEKI